MRIIKEAQKTIPFCSITTGNIFEYNYNMWIKMEPLTTSEGTYNTVNLNTGVPDRFPDRFPDRNLVVKKEATLYVRDK